MPKLFLVFFAKGIDEKEPPANFLAGGRYLQHAKYSASLKETGAPF